MQLVGPDRSQPRNRDARPLSSLTHRSARHNAQFSLGSIPPQAVVNVYSTARVCEILPEHPVAALGYLLFQNLLSLCWYVATLAFLHFSMSALLQSEIPTALAERVLPGPQTFSAKDISLSALLSRADANKDYCLDTGELTALAASSAPSQPRTSSRSWRAAWSGERLASAPCRYRLLSSAWRPASALRRREGGGGRGGGFASCAVGATASERCAEGACSSH